MKLLKLVKTITHRDAKENIRPIIFDVSDISNFPKTEQTHTLAGEHEGNSFTLKVTPRGNYKMSTWYITLSENDNGALSEATDTIHRMALDNAQQFATTSS